MTLQEMLAAKREQAGRALTAAREIAAKQRETPDKGPELEESFKKANADFVTLNGEIERLLREVELEAQAKAFVEPAPGERFAHRGQDQNGGGSPKGGPAKRGSEEFKKLHREAFDAMLRSGQETAFRVLQHAGMGPAEMHALMGTQGDLGGFLIPDDFQATIVKDLAGFAVIRNIARVIPTGGNVVVMPSIQPRVSPDSDIYSSTYVGSWKAEGYVTGGTAPAQQNAPKFGQERIPVHVWQPDAIEVTMQLMEDSKAPLDAILSETIAETRALDEDSAFINGDGVGKPLGLMDTSVGIATVNSGHATLLTYGGLVDLFSSLPAQYRQNMRWLMSSQSFGAILKLADTQARPIFTPNEIPGNLWTKPISFSEFMPDASGGASAKPIIIGDFRYYGIADRQELRIQRLLERFAPNVGILPTARVGGQPLRKAAFRIQNISA